MLSVNIDLTTLKASEAFPSGRRVHCSVYIALRNALISHIDSGEAPILSLCEKPSLSNPHASERFARIKEKIYSIIYGGAGGPESQDRSRVEEAELDNEGEDPGAVAEDFEISAV